MGEFVVKMPDIGEGIAEAEVAEWLVGEGDPVAKDAPMVEVMTDKARVEIPSPVAGTVLRHGAPPGDFIAVGGELIRLTVEGRGNVRAESKQPAAAEATAPPPREPAPEVAGAPDGPQPPVPAPEPAEASQPSSPPTSGSGTPSQPTGSDAGTGPAASAGRKVLAAPAVRGRAQEAGVDLAEVTGTGPDGRVTAADLEAHLTGSGAVSGSAGGASTSPGAGGDDVEEIPITGIRRVTARRISEAWRSIPHITIVEEVDVTELEKLRAALDHADRPKPTVLPFLIRALVRALGDQPEFNAHFDDATETIRRFAPVHVGIATQAPDGLKVPVLRHAERLDLWATASGVEEVSAAARDGRATRDQLGGSTITVTSLGRLGAFATTPIVNKPEVAIVGVNRMAVRPLWNGSAFVPRTMMNLSSSFDHRVIDGHAAATFVARLKDLLETPALIFVPD